MAELDLPALAATRATAQGVPSGAPHPVAAVRRMLCMQGQDAHAPLLGIAARTAPPITRAAVEDAFVRGDLVRSWTMRGTLHVIAPEDLGWLLALTGPRTLLVSRAARQREGVDDQVLSRAAAVATAVLGSAGLRRPELLAAFTGAGIDVTGSRGYHVLVALAADGRIVAGARDAGQYRFLRAPDPGPPLDRDEALARLAVRYLTGHGPATVHDLAWWSGLPVQDVRRGVEAAGPALSAVEVEGVPYLTLGDGPGVPHAPATGVPVVLPAYDELVLGYRDRTAALDPVHHPRLAPTSNGRFLPIVTVDGRIVATWSATPTGAMVDPIEPLEPALLAESGRAATAAAAWLREESHPPDAARAAGDPASDREDGVQARASSACSAGTSGVVRRPISRCMSG